MDTGTTYTSLKAYYPASHALSEYVFQREGCLQVNWKTTTGSLLPLNAHYTPTESTNLKAQWQARIQ